MKPQTKTYRVGLREREAERRDDRMATTQSSVNWFARIFGHARASTAVPARPVQARRISNKFISASTGRASTI